MRRHVLLVLAFASSSALAHVQLEEPPRRYDDMKGAVCGKGGGLDGRTNHFSRFEPGETIDVRWIETIDHVGSFRFAFDDDGADRDDFNANVLDTIDDPSNESGKEYTGSITLPDIECTNCTLQFIQVMTTGEGNDDNTYFQCADIVLGDGESASGSGCSSSSTAPGCFALLLLVLRRARGAKVKPCR